MALQTPNPPVRTQTSADTAPTIASVDSLATDSLQCKRIDLTDAYPFEVYSTADSLYPGFRVTAPLSHAVSAEEVFGTASVTVQPTQIPRPPVQSLTDNAVFQGFVLLLAATYAVLLYHNLNDVRALLSRISRDTASGKRLFDDPGGSGFSRFLNTVTAIGMLFIGVVVVKYGDTLMMSGLQNTIPDAAVLLMSLLATAAVTAVVLFQTLTVRIAGAVTLAQPFISQLMLLRRTYFSLAVIITSPILLLFALCPRGTGDVWFVLIALELAVTAVLYLRETLNLFLSKKVSILHWFLYLCIVEIFPISFIWLLAVR